MQFCFTFSNSIPTFENSVDQDHLTSGKPANQGHPHVESVLILKLHNWIDCNSKAHIEWKPIEYLVYMYQIWGELIVNANALLMHYFFQVIQAND